MDVEDGSLCVTGDLLQAAHYGLDLESLVLVGVVGMAESVEDDEVVLLFIDLGLQEFDMLLIGECEVRTVEHGEVLRDGESEPESGRVIAYPAGQERGGILPGEIHDPHRLGDRDGSVFAREVSPRGADGQVEREHALAALWGAMKMGEAAAERPGRDRQLGTGIPDAFDVSVRSFSLGELFIEIEGEALGAREAEFFEFQFLGGLYGIGGIAHGFLFPTSSISLLRAMRRMSAMSHQTSTGSLSILPPSSMAFWNDCSHNESADAMISAWRWNGVLHIFKKGCPFPVHPPP